MSRLHSKLAIPMAVFVVISCLSLVTSACTPAQIQQLEGLIQNVDTVNGTITVTTKDGKTVTVNINSDSQVTANGSNTSVFTLEPGTNVKINEKGGVARVIDDRVAVVNGVVSQLQGSLLTVTTANSTAVTTNVTSQTQIKLANDQAGTLSDIKVGVKAQVKYDPQTLNAFRVFINAREKAEIEGIIAQISGSNITIQTKAKGGLQATVIADNTTSIRSGNATVALTDLKAGSRIHARFDPSTNVASAITLQQQVAPTSGQSNEERKRQTSDNRSRQSDDNRIRQGSDNRSAQSNNGRGGER